LLTNLLILLAITAGIVGIITFILYGRARMKEQEQREKLFLRIHYAALFVVVLAGLIYMFYMVGSSD
jgi:hypothetical protein